MHEWLFQIRVHPEMLEFNQEGVGGAEVEDAEEGVRQERV